MSDDLARIIALPRRKPDWSEVEDWPILYKNNRCPGCKLCFGGEPKLWPVQLAALREAMEMGGLAGPVQVGGGKSLIALLLPAVLRAKKTVLLVKPSLKSQLKREVVNYANHFWIPTKYIRLVSYSELSNADKGEILEKVSPDLIVADECFPYETLIRTSIGDRFIGDIVNDSIPCSVLSADTDGVPQWKKVVKKYKKELKEKLVVVKHQLGELVCTAKHKIWTQRGYVRAKELTSEDILNVHYDKQNLHSLQSTFLPQIYGKKELSEKLLFQNMCSTEGGSGHAAFGKKSHTRDTSEVKYSYEVEQPFAASWSIRAHKQSKKRNTYKESKWEWERVNRTTKDSSEQIELRSGVCCAHEGCLDVCEDTPLLQSRSGDVGYKTGYRSRRTDTQKQKNSRMRCEENKCFEASRVDSVTVLEQRDFGKYGLSSRKNYVYDLEVEDNHNYTANGVLVSNCHLLRHPNAARTKRFLRYMKAHQEVKFVGLSGTMTTRSIKDYAHFFDLALKDGSPLPRKETELYAWAEALDDATTKAPAPPGKLKLLCAGDETVRDGFRRRVLDTKGVVSTPESALGTSLSLIAISGVGDEKIAEALAELRRTWTWQGEEFEDALAFHRIAKQLASGFYYRWAWPGGVADKEWLSARAAWHAEVREYLLDNSTPGMDSPLLLARAAQAGLWQSYTWDSWSRLRDRTPPPVEAVWISEAVVNSALHWAKNNEGIIWYEHDAVGRKIAEIGKLPFFGPGEKAAALLDSAHPTIMPNIVCSIRAHGTGKNLQAYSKMYVTSPPSNGQIWEQLIDRMHRPDQQADAVEVYIVSHTK